MTNCELIDLIARQAASVYPVGLLLSVGFGPRQLSGEAGPANARQAVCVYVAGISFSRALRGAQQTGPPKNPAGLGNDLFVTPMGPQRDLFGTPFGPHFAIRTGAKYANLPDFQRNPLRGTEVCTKSNVARQTGSWRRRAIPNCGEAFFAPPLSDGGTAKARGFVDGSHRCFPLAHPGRECDVTTTRCTLGPRGVCVQHWPAAAHDVK